MKTRQTLHAKKTALTVAGILDAISDEIAMVRQNLESNFLDSAASHKLKADTLIELLEVNETGSTGAAYLGLLTPGCGNGDYACGEHDTTERLVILIKHFKRKGGLRQNWIPSSEIIPTCK